MREVDEDVPGKDKFGARQPVESKIELSELAPCAAVGLVQSRNQVGNDVAADVAVKIEITLAHPEEIATGDVKKRSNSNLPQNGGGTSARRTGPGENPASHD